MMCNINAGGALVDDAIASRVSLDSDGFTVNFSVTNDSYSVMWKALG